MKDFRKLHFYFLAASSILLACAYALFEMKCFGNCSFYSNRGVIKPMMAFNLPLLMTLLFLLIFKVRVFELWLKYIASWFIPVAILVIASISVYSSGILSVGRGEAAFQLMVLLGVITVIFAIGYTVITRLKK